MGDRIATPLDDEYGIGSAFVRHAPVDLDFPDPSRTRQEFAEECDVNQIMKKFEATGVISHQNPRQPMYLDLSEPIDLQRALDIVAEATESFMSLPARVRAEFDNDPVRFVSFAEDPSNLGQLREWGLAPPEAPVSPNPEPPPPEAAPPHTPST